MAGSPEIGEEAVDEPEVVGEDDVEDEADRHGSDDEGEQHAHAPQGLGADVAVEHRRDEQGQEQLGHRGEHEDAEGVAQGGPEVGLLQDPEVLIEADERSGAAHEIPVLEGDHRGEDDGEEADDQKHQEERRDVEVGREA